jgi:hydrogenase nickel incorporation protein HypB
MAQIKVVERVLKANDAVAAANRARLDRAGILAVNLMSAPGSGKTALLEATIPALAPARCAVLVGDLQTTRDAERLGRVAADVVQINTGRGCHLTADQVAEGLAHLDLVGISYLFIENVGNMVCPAGCALGEHRSAVALSLPEGDDKAAKLDTFKYSFSVRLGSILKIYAANAKKKILKKNSIPRWRIVEKRYPIKIAAI